MQCKKCLVEKLSSDFYTNDKTCKDCRRSMVKANRAKKADYYREYDRERASHPGRVDARNAYAKTEQGRQAMSRARKAYAERYPMRRAAHVIVGNAIRDGKLVNPQAYESCGSSHKIEAHHDDYSKPLTVRWLCESCHKEWHRNNEPLYS